MRILIVCPAPARSRTGNRVTARRWRALLRGLGHDARIAGRWERQPCDLLVALHARRSADSVARIAARCPQVPRVVAMTGTDLYRDLARGGAARRSVDLADRVIVLHPEGASALPRAARRKARAIVQSIPPARARPARARDAFEVAVIGHLRPVKDPFRAEVASRGLPPASRVRVVHAGAALAPRLAAEARARERANPRYRWLGEVPRHRARALIARARVLVLSSRAEGGAHVVGEACVAGTPVLASRVPGNLGLLGRDHPGAFPAGDTRALRALLLRAERDRAFSRALAARSRALRPLFSPARERAAWRRLLRELRAVRRRRRR